MNNYIKYKKYFFMIDGYTYRSLFDIIIAWILIFLFYIFNIIVYRWDLTVAVGLSIILIFLIVLAIIRLVRQIKLRKNAKAICYDSEITKAKVLSFKVYLSGKSSFSKVELLLPNNFIYTETINCGTKKMMKYKRIGITIIQSKDTKRKIILIAQNKI